MNMNAKTSIKCGVHDKCEIMKLKSGIPKGANSFFFFFTKALQFQKLMTHCNPFTLCDQLCPPRCQISISFVSCNIFLFLTSVVYATELDFNDQFSQIFKFFL